MNYHIIHGRLTRDPELTPRKTSDGSDRVNYTVAVDRRYGDETEFFDCVAFGKRAETIDKFFRKGQEIICWGEGQIHKYPDKNGGPDRKSYSIFVEGFDFCGSSKKSDGKSGDSFDQADADCPF
jgi:single-strand DNA-binding protein